MAMIWLAALAVAAAADPSQICPGGFVALLGNTTDNVYDRRPVVTWVAPALTIKSGRNLTIGRPLLSIAGFRLLEQQWGAGVADLSPTGVLYALGEKAVSMNSSEVGGLELAAVDVRAGKLLARSARLPVVNMWRGHDPIDDWDGHQLLIRWWNGQLLVGGPTSWSRDARNWTLFSLDPSSLAVHWRLDLGLEAFEMVQGMAGLDQDRAVLHLAVDRVYQGQVIYHVNLTERSWRVTAVPAFYWMNMLYVPAANALFGAGKQNQESKMAVESSWRWNKLDLETGLFSNKSLAGPVGCIPIDNPEDNAQLIAGLGADGAGFVGLTCQSSPSNIVAGVGVVDWAAGRLDGFWQFAGLYPQFDMDVLGVWCAAPGGQPK